MRNAIEVVKELGYDLAFLPNKHYASRINVTQKRIEIGTEAQKETYFDEAFVCLAHEAGHALDEAHLTKTPVFREITAWKIALKEFLTFQPEIRLKILREAQFHLNRYVQAYIFSESVEYIEIDEVW
jgi:hypothetical protein